MARTNRRLSAATRYGKYDGGPDPLAAPVDITEALAAIGDEVMAGSSPERALREFLRRGGSQTGMDDLARQVAERRRELTQKHNLDGTLREIRELLEKAVGAERNQLARDVELDDDDRLLAEMQLENLPPSPAAAVSELNGYNWQSAEARADFEKIKDLLGRELLDQRFAGMKKALENATDDDRAAVNEMLKDLNALLDAHQRGEDTPEQFDEFMKKHGDAFPDNPKNVEELLDSLAERAAAAQRMRNSMTPEQRSELDALAQEAFGSPELMQSLEQLDGTLQALRPGEDWGGSESMNGGEGLGLGDGTGVFQDIAELDALSEQLAQSSGDSRIGDVDLDTLARQLGDAAAVNARTLQQLEKALRETGTMKRDSDGRLKLTPKAMRQLGKALLKDVANRMSGRQGNRDLRRAGAAGERSGATREWSFGDTEPWDVTRTITNAITRTAGQGGGVAEAVRKGDSPAGTRGSGSAGSDGAVGSAGSDGLAGLAGAVGVRIEIGDVQVQETEGRTQACVALLVDTSFSMAIEGRWVPMKRTALALHTLIRSRFRGDELQLIAFGRHAEVMDIDQLTGLDSQYDKGTNLHHALLLANRHFRKHPNAQPVLLIVTDGEPTSHLEASGEVFFDYPPHPATIAFAVRELDNSARLGAQTTFFRLGDDPGLARFVESMAKRVDGSVVAPELDELGVAVVGSYLGSRLGGRAGVRVVGSGTGYRGNDYGRGPADFFSRG